MKKYVLQGVIALFVIGVVAALFFRERAEERAERGGFEKLLTLQNRCPEPIPENRLKEFLGQFEVAKSDVEQDPDRFNSWMRLGLLKHTFCDWEGARDIWEYASVLRPKNSLSFGNLGSLYADKLNDPVRAEANYLKAIENEEAFQALVKGVENPPPVNATYYVGLHELYRYKFPDDPQKQAAAVEVLLRGIRFVPTAIDLKKVLASYYRDIGNIEEAIKWFEEVLKQTPENGAVKAEVQRLKSLPKQT